MFEVHERVGVPKVLAQLVSRDNFAGLPEQGY